MRDLHSNPLPGEPFHGNPGFHYAAATMFDNTLPNGLRLENNLASQQQPVHVMVQRDSLAAAPAPGFYNEVNNTNAVPTGFYEEPFQDFGFMPTDGQFGQSFGFTPRDAYLSQDVEFGVWDFDLESVELQYQNVASPSQVRQPESSQRATQSPVISKDVSKRYAAFERSPWIWKPTQKDQAMTDSSNLNLDEESIPTILTPASPTATMDEFLSCCINSKIRDQMLGLVLNVRRGSNKVPSYPSLNLLNNFIQVYFVQASCYVDNFIHTPTLNPEKSLPHLLTAVVAAGTSFISTPAIWKMGLVLHEVIRHAVGEYVSSAIKKKN